MLSHDGKLLVTSDGFILFGKAEQEDLPDIRPLSNMVDRNGKVLFSSDYKVLLGKELDNKESYDLGDKLI